MNGLVSLLDADRLAPWLSRVMVEGALDEFARFLLVLIRLSGLMILGPLLGMSSVPMNVRALLTLALALAITPTIPLQLDRGFDRLDEDADGLLARDEVPPGLAPRLDVVRQVGHTDYGGWSREEYRAAMAIRLPQNLLDFVGVAAGELSLGVLLGLGAMIVLSGLQLAGQIVDQQAGFSLGSIINPDLDSTGSISGQALSMLGLTLFLVMDPLNGHVMMLKILVGTFEVLPVGNALVSTSAIELTGLLVQESLILGIRVAAPLMVMMTLVDLTLGFLSHSVPQINVQVVGYAARAGICILILAVMLSGVPETLLRVLPDSLELLGRELSLPSLNPEG